MMHEFFPMFVTQVWQVTLLAVVVWIVTKTFCKRRPHLGHALWLLVLIKCVVPPVFSSSTSVYSWMLMHDNPKRVADRFVEPEPPTAVAGSPTVVARPMEVMPIVPKVQTAPQPAVTQTRPRAVSTPSKPAPASNAQTPPAFSSQPVRRPATTLQQVAVTAPTVVKTKPLVRAAPIRTLSATEIRKVWVLKIWLAGAAMFLLVTLFRYARFRSWVRRQKSVEAFDVELQIQSLAKQLRLRRKIRVNVVDAEFGPAVIGLLRPMIVLPNSIVADQTAEQLEPILGHELLHLRRGDIYWSVLQVVACSLMWFHPLVWLASRNVTRESEKCCDEETIANFQCDRANYARALVDILEQKSRLRIAPVVPGVRPADITSSRLERIMQPDNGTCRRTPRWIWALALLIAVVVLPGAAMVQSQEQRRSESAKPPTIVDAVGETVFQSTASQWQSEATQRTKTSFPPTNRIATLDTNSQVIYLGIPDSAISVLKKQGRIEAPISNAQISRIQISDSNKPKAGPIRRIDSVLRGDKLVFKFTNEHLKQIADCSFEYQVTDEQKGKFRTAVIEHVPPSTQSSDNSFGGGFKPGAAKAQFEAKVIGMAKGDEGQKKILDELTDNVWGSREAQTRLLNCKNPRVDFEVRVAKVPLSLIEKTSLDGDDLSEHQIQKFKVGELLELIAKTDNAEISTVATRSLYAGSNTLQTISAQIRHSFVSGVQGFSILDPARLEPLMQEHMEGVTFSCQVKKADGILNLIEGQLQFQTLDVSAGRKLPLKLGSNEIMIENAVPKRLIVKCEWSLPEDKAQIIFGRADEKSKSQMIVIIESSRKPPLVDEDEDLTLDDVLKIKSELPSEATQLTNPFGVTPVVKDSSGEESEAKPSVTSSKPMSLILQCGQANQERSLNTKIGLGDKSSLTIEGEVESQQISGDSVQVSGKNFVFNNEKEGSFNAKAGVGSVSFKRGEPIENSLRLSLKDNAILQFAGIEFKASIIECSPNRVAAIRGSSGVTVNIPEIDSSVSADRVEMNLKTLTFDFEGNVVVKRDIGKNSFPMLVKGNHVGWSLVTGHLEMRDSSPNRSARQSNGFGSPTAAVNPNLGSSVFEPRLLKRSGFTSGASTSAVRPSQTQRSQFSPLRQTQNGN